MAAMNPEHTEGKLLDLPRRPRWSAIAVAALIALSAVVACNKVWTYDVFWHLKSGQWMLENRQVLDHDPFSVPDEGAGPREWVNVHWLFQVIVAAAYGAGGFAALVVLKMGVFAATVAALALWLRRRAGPALLMLAGAAIILGVETRVRVRPEIFTFLFLSVTLVVVESVRRGGSPSRLWWLLPLNIVWVNMHGVYLVGLAAAWGAVGGAWLDRLMKRDTAGRLAGGKALAPMAAATVAPLVASPWPVAAALHPLLLRTRVSGEDRYYSFGVEEFRPTYELNPFKAAPVAVALLLLLAVAAVVVAVCVAETTRRRRRSVPAGHVIWLATFLVPAMMAVRNVTLLVIPAAFVLAIHGGQLCRLLPRPGRPRRWLGAAARVAMLLALLGAALGYATEAVYRWQGRSASRFGLGLVNDVHPVEMAKWLGQSQLSGDILPLNFGNGGTFIYYSHPRRKVWMDGRLELHSLERFRGLHEIGRNLLSSIWASDDEAPYGTPLPPTVRFIVVPCDSVRHIRAMNNCERFRLVYIDRAAVCFARIPLPGEANAGKLRQWHRAERLPWANLNEFDRPLDPARGALLDAETSRPWYRQNVQPTHWRIGAVFFSLGLDDLAIRYLNAAERLGLQEPLSRMGLLAEAHRRASLFRPIEPEQDLPVDPNLCRALALLRKVDLRDLRDRRARKYALVRVSVLKDARQIDAAAEAMGQYLDDLPIPDRWRPGTDDLAVRDSIQMAYLLATTTAAQFDLAGMTPAMRAKLLLREDVGLIDRAIAELESAGELPPRGRLGLGDLYLRKGQTAKARRSYASVGGKDQWAVRMRLGLCDWADGDFPAATERLREATRLGPPAPEPLLYVALLGELLAYFSSAPDALAGYRPPADQAQRTQADRLVAQVIARFKLRGIAIPPAGGGE